LLHHRKHSFPNHHVAIVSHLHNASLRPQLLVPGIRVTPEVAHRSFVGNMSHALDHALRNAPSDKPLPPWLQQLQAQWQAAKDAFGSTRGSESRPVSIDGSSLGKRKPMRRQSSLHSLKEALLHTKDALLAAIGMLPRKHAVALDDSWPYRIQSNLV
jgi:hypothetical protein